MSKDTKDLFEDTSVATMIGASRPSHWILWTACAFIIIATIYASITRLDEVTQAQGKVVPSKQVQIIQNLEGGILQSVKVREGEDVKQGQVLMTIDDTQYASQYHESLAKSASIQLKIQRLFAEINDNTFQPETTILKQYPELVSSELALHRSLLSSLHNQMDIILDQKEQKQQELAELMSKKKKLSKSYELISKELSMLKPLVKEGAASKMEVLRLERQTNEVEGDLNTVSATILKSRRSVSEADKKFQQAKLNFRSTSLESLTKAKSDLAQMQENNKALKDRYARTTIKSPVDGTVKQIYVNTVGGVIKPGMELVEIVPKDDALLIEAKVRPADIAFLHPGQEATVKLTAYDFSIYGGLQAKLVNIGADTVLDEKGEGFYEIQVRTNDNHFSHDGKSLPILPGMMASVDILTGEKSIMDYILKPILKTKQAALHER